LLSFITDRIYNRISVTYPIEFLARFRLDSGNNLSIKSTGSHFAILLQSVVMYWLPVVCQPTSVKLKKELSKHYEFYHKYNRVPKTGDGEDGRESDSSQTVSNLASTFTLSPFLQNQS
jgi:hypothetical protein